MEKSAENRLTLPSLPLNSSSWTLYPSGWKRVQTALPRQRPSVVGGGNGNGNGMGRSTSTNKHNSLHQEPVLFLGNGDQIVQLL